MFNELGNTPLVNDSLINLESETHVNSEICLKLRVDRFFPRRTGDKPFFLPLALISQSYLRRILLHQN